MGVEDGGRGARAPLKFGKIYFSGNYYVKFGHFTGQSHVKFGNFVNFSGKNHVKFGHFADFNTYFLGNLVPPKVTELLRNSCGVFDSERTPHN